MAKTNIPTTYIALGLLVPSTVMMVSRIVGQGASKAKADTIAPMTQITPMPQDINLWAHRQIPIEPTAQPDSPFWYEETPEGLFPAPMEIGNDQTQVVDTGLTPADIRLTTILPNKSNPLAIINDKPCRLGDYVYGHWELLEINGKNRTIVLQNPEGKKMTIGLTKDP